MIEALIKALSLPNDTVNQLLAKSAVEWINGHTTLSIKTVEDVSNMPASALLFILKYKDIVGRDKTVASESAQGLSQSFNTSQTISMSLYEIASELLSPYLLSTVTVKAGETGWSYG